MTRHGRSLGWIVCLATVLTAATAAGGQVTTDGNYRVLQSTLGGLVEAGDRFGAALAAGDFNRDGYADLAIGTPGEDVGAIDAAGAVVVAWGSPAGLGLGAVASQALHQDVGGVPGVAEAGDRFGAAVVAADFNGDLYDDLAIGVPGEGVGEHARGGAVHVFLGSASGLVVPATSPLLTGDEFFPNYESETDANFGYALAACDRNADGKDDLAIGIPSADNVAENRIGKLLETPGAAGGISIAGGVLWTFVDSEEGDQLGYSLACGELDGDGEADLVVGAPYDSVGGFVRSLTSAHGIFSYTAPPPAASRWGESIAIGSFRPATPPWLAVGFWGRDGPSALGIGEIALGQYDDGGGFSFFAYHQGEDGLEETAETFDHFGEVLAVGDFNRDGYDDLVVGVPDEDLYDGTEQLAVNGGLVQTIPGGTGLTMTGLWPSADAVFHWGAFAFPPLDHDDFGAALATGDFNKDGIDDLAIGAPGAEWNSQAATGVVQILLGSKPGWIFGDGFEVGGVWKWSASAP